ncbi:MAG: molybdate ABC transporter substrate-binding protein [Duodenibacillus sp.]|nr:molybdate ABC transporter substrate-binding protein [Duodenibacillus sp.]
MKKIIALAALGLMAGSVAAGEINVAVAANFTAPSKEIAAAFEKATGHKVVLSFGATGMFYGQIKEGAPFDVLLAADDKTPAKAVKEGYGVEGSAYTYAVGKLVFWSSNPQLIPQTPTVLEKGVFEKCAVANPKLAPYGQAAYETLDAMGLMNAVKPKFVEGKNIGATFNMVKTGNAEVGFVALSQVYKDGKFTGGSGWIVNPKYYNPIRQDAVLLKASKDPKTAKAFLDYLKKSPEAQAVKTAYGYAAP